MRVMSDQRARADAGCFATPSDKPAGNFVGSRVTSRRQFLFAVASLILFSDVQAHNFHVSICDIQFNPHSGNAEIVHSYPMHDIDSAFWLMYGRRMDTALAVDEALLQAYFDKTFVIETANKSRLKIRWVGVNSDADTLTVYQELPGIQLAAALTLQNTVLMEHFPTQTNNVNVRMDRAARTTIAKGSTTITPTTTTLTFDRKNTVQRLP